MIVAQLRHGGDINGQRPRRTVWGRAWGHRWGSISAKVAAGKQQIWVVHSSGKPSIDQPVPPPGCCSVRLGSAYCSRLMSSQDSKSGVTRLRNPLPEAELAGVRAGSRRRPRHRRRQGGHPRACNHSRRRHRWPTRTSCGEPAVAAISPGRDRDAPHLASLTARSGVRRALAAGRGPTHSSPAVRPETSRSPRPRTAVTTHGRRSPVIGVRRERHTRRAWPTIRCTMTAIRSPAARRRRDPAVALARTRSTASGTHRVRRPAPIRTSRRTTARRRPRRGARADGELARRRVSGPRREARRRAPPGRAAPIDPQDDAAGTRTPAASSSPRRAALPPTSGTSPDRTSRSCPIRATIALPSVRGTVYLKTF